MQLSLLSTLPIDSGLLDECADLGVTPIGYSPLGLGVLSGKYVCFAWYCAVATPLLQSAPTRALSRYSLEDNLLPSGPRGFLFKQLLPSCKPLLGTLREVATQRQVSMAAVAIAWAMSKGVVVIVGMKSPEQVEDNLKVPERAHKGASLSPRPLIPESAQVIITTPRAIFESAGTHVETELS